MRLTNHELQCAINDLVLLVNKNSPLSPVHEFAKTNLQAFMTEQKRRATAPDPAPTPPPPAPITIDHAPTCVFNAATVRAIIEAGRIVITVDGIRTLTVTAETIIVEMESRQL